MSEQTVYGAHSSSAQTAPRTRTRIHHLQKMKAEGHKWAMLTAYDYSTARVFDDAGIPDLGHDVPKQVTVHQAVQQRQRRQGLIGRRIEIAQAAQCCPSYSGATGTSLDVVQVARMSIASGRCCIDLSHARFLAHPNQEPVWQWDGGEELVLAIRHRNLRQLTSVPDAK